MKRKLIFLGCCLHYLSKSLIWLICKSLIQLRVFLWILRHTHRHNIISIFRLGCSSSLQSCAVSLMPAGCSSNLPVQHAPGQLCSVLLVSLLVYIQMGAHKGLASIPGARQHQLAFLNSQLQPFGLPGCSLYHGYHRHGNKPLSFCLQP